MSEINHSAPIKALALYISTLLYSQYKNVLRVSLRTYLSCVVPMLTSLRSPTNCVFLLLVFWLVWRYCIHVFCIVNLPEANELLLEELLLLPLLLEESFDDDDDDDDDDSDASLE